MSTIKLSSTGDFKHSRRFLKNITKKQFFKNLSYYGQKGVDALSKATPVDTGKTAASWGYKITEEEGKVTIAWTNSNVVNGIPIAIIIQYGHATGNGGWVEGRDYINPALQPIFDGILRDVWKEVTR